MFGAVALFVPAVSEKKLAKAGDLEADSLYFDLEDSVAPEQKDEARALLRQVLDRRSFKAGTLLARINGHGTPQWDRDIEELARRPVLRALLLPNANLEAVRALSLKLDRLDSPLKIVPLIETARGLEEAREAVLASARVAGLQFGGEDYTASLGVKRTLEGEELGFARARLANLAHAYGLEAVDTPFTNLHETDWLRKDCRRARAMGFTGKAVIHPGQIEVVRQFFRPEQAEIEEARRVLESHARQSGEGVGVFTVDGAMIDAPILERARQVLRKAGAEKP
jgi:citrate lyase subunit beta/citryl-CoA lyase